MTDTTTFTMATCVAIEPNTGTAHLITDGDYTICGIPTSPEWSLRRGDDYDCPWCKWSIDLTGSMIAGADDDRLAQGRLLRSTAMACLAAASFVDPCPDPEDEAYDDWLAGFQAEMNERCEPWARRDNSQQAEGRTMNYFDAACDYCDNVRQPRYWKLSAVRPPGWPSAAPPVSIGSFCSVECAIAEPTATLADAQAVAAVIANGCTCGHGDPTEIEEFANLWRRLLDAYPEPISV